MAGWANMDLFGMMEQMDQEGENLRRDVMSPDAFGGDEARMYSIGDLAREFDVTARTLRFYEEKGLIEPARSGFERLYSRRDRARLKLVLMGKNVGFSLEEIREMLDLYDIGDGGRRQLEVARERFSAQIDRLERQRRDVDTALAELRRASDKVSEMLAGKGDK